MYGYDNGYAAAGYGYGGRYAGAEPEMRQRLAAMQQQAQRYQQPQSQYGMQQSVIAGRIVTSVEEARAAQIPLDGTLVYFPAPNERKIYVKSVNLEGQAVFEVYQLATGQEEKPAYADSAMVAGLQKRVERLETLLMRGAEQNVQPDASFNVQPNEANGTVTSQQ